MTAPEALAATHAAAFADTRPWSADEFATLLAAPGALLTGDARSFVLGRVVLDEAEVLTVATRPEARRRGLARARLAAFIEAARAAGAATLFLEVAADNIAARALYAAAGLSETGRRRGYYRTAAGTPVDAIVMTLPLGAPSTA